MGFRELLKEKEFIILDGATGTMIQKSGVQYDEVPETLNITHPELIASFHKAYVDAGADVVYANTSVRMRTNLRDAATVLKKL